MKLTPLSILVLSYCEIPEEILGDKFEEASCDTFVKYSITPKEDQSKFSDNFDLDNWILEENPQISKVIIVTRHLRERISIIVVNNVSK